MSKLLPFPDGCDLGHGIPPAEENKVAQIFQGLVTFPATLRKLTYRWIASAVFWLYKAKASNLMLPSWLLPNPHASRL